MESRISRLVRAQQHPVIGWGAKQILGLYGIEIPTCVPIGDDLKLVHKAYGTVVSPLTEIGSHVTIYHNVTIARADSWVPIGDRHFEPIRVGDSVVLCPGAVILGREQGLTIGRGTVIGANSVLTESTGENEVWVGSPARRVSGRDRHLRALTA